MYQSEISAEEKVRAQMQALCSGIVQGVRLQDGAISQSERLNDKGLRILRLAFVDGWIDKLWLRHEVEQNILRVGREGLATATRNKGPVPPDHVRSPAALAYLLQQSADARQMLPDEKFDHGDTQYTFMKNGDTIVEKITHELWSLIERVEMPVF